MITEFLERPRPPGRPLYKVRNCSCVSLCNFNFDGKHLPDFVQENPTAKKHIMDMFSRNVRRLHLYDVQTRERQTYYRSSPSQSPFQKIYVCDPPQKLPLPPRIYPPFQQLYDYATLHRNYPSLPEYTPPFNNYTIMRPSTEATSPSQNRAYTPFQQL